MSCCIHDMLHAQIDLKYSRINLLATQMCIYIYMYMTIYVYNQDMEKIDIELHRYRYIYVQSLMYNIVFT